MKESSITGDEEEAKALIAWLERQAETNGDKKEPVPKSTLPNQ